MLCVYVATILCHMHLVKAATAGYVGALEQWNHGDSARVGYLRFPCDSGAIHVVSAIPQGFRLACAHDVSTSAN